MVKRYSMSRPEIVLNCRYYESHPSTTEIKGDLNLGSETKLVLYLNSVYPGQGVEQLIDAAAMMPKDVHLATLGPIPLEEYGERLRGQAAAAGLNGRFHMLDSKPGDEMLRYASGADIGAIPRQNTSLNNYISLPNRVFELLMAGLPIAAPSLPDMKQFVEENDLGMSFDETSPEDMSRILSDMLEPATLAELRNAVQTAAKRYCWENEGEHYRSIVEAVARV
jgi:glycosyltransferase involved in cell wall biosynthesis